ncbi:uncharacterized protein LOC113760860 isoform X2 [Coffea eugenioides]|uniref:uncharacterized protein LOC113760860 isoform X2 n=1 Tax=Coffea eugenioides TaxID=49369 RepID=UPI000F611A85|nr:uncharacterized protein LOC113760860 isoform X2 [Coffea eugenioides]
MAERKQQFLQDLYNATQTLSHPKITPILRGNCRMRGPVDDSDHANMVHSQVDEKYSSYPKNLNSDHIAESGTCNVCFAPCSACLHITQHEMGSKVDECSGEASAENALSFSVNDAFPNENFVECEIVRKSDGSKNVYCEATMNSDVSATSETTTVFPKVEDSKGQEDHDHVQSCITAAEDTKLSNSNDRNEDGLVETPSKTAGGVTHLMKARGNCSHPTMDKSRLHEPSPDGLKDNLLACPGGHLTSLSTKAVSCGPTDSISAVNTVDFVEKKENIDKIDRVMRSRSVHDAVENSFESHPMDESDDSDMVEHDVKVCDICGDAGREDLLAICCRCSDGAEHTYCMKEMVDKVPEGDWLCEECRLEAEMKNPRQEKVCSVDASEKINSSGQANPENASFAMKSETKGSDVVGNKIANDPPSVKILGKRQSDDAEVFCAVKKRVLESDIGSAKVSTSSGAAAISCDSSFKLLDRGKAKPTQHSSSVTVSAHDTATSPSGSRLHTSQGLFIKSNSFNSLTMKPKIKLVDDFVPQKQRSVKSSVSLEKKEGAARSISKSSSFRLTNSGRPNIGESKVKMISPKFSRIQETKGSKHTKDRNLFEKKNSFTSQKVSGSLPMANPGALAVKNDQKLVSSAEPTSLSSARNFHDTKAIQSESRSMILSKSSSFAVRTGSEPPVSLGELKRQASTNSFGVSSLNGNSGHDMKPNQGSPEEYSSNSLSGERQPCNLNEGLPDSLCRASRPRESINFGERTKDGSWTQSRQNSMISGRTLSCRKCKEIGHLSQSCTADHPGSPASDTTAAKNPREMVECKDKLKAAIEAAVLRKPGIYRKHRVSDHSDDSSLLKMNSEIATQDQVLDSSNQGNLCSSGEMQEGYIILGNSTTDSSKQETVDDIVQQFPNLSVEASTSRTAGVFPIVPLERSSLVRDVPNGVSPATSTLLKTLAIPDHEYIWQGVFEVNRIGEPLNVFDGIQAHLSTCASPRVLEAVNKFANKVLLNEVPRLTMWPVQFQDNGVKEDNVALFFFAKDLASYEKSYKVLLDNMMKNDLALKGSFDGFELMIFPSNQLPEKSQRWNALFFLWGVFRGSSKSLASEEAVMELPCLSSSQALKQGSDGKVSSEVTNNDPVLSAERKDNKLDSNFFSVVQSSNAKSCGEAAQTSTLSDEMKHTSTSLEEGVESDQMIEQELQTSAESTQRVSGFCRSQETPLDQNSHLNQLHASHYFGESLACAGGIGSVGNIGTGDISENMGSTRHQPRPEDGSLNKVSSSGIQNEIVKDNYGNCLLVDCGQRMPQAAYASRSQVQSGVAVDNISIEEVRTSKKQKTHVESSSSSEGLVAEIRGGHSGLPVQATGSDEAFDGCDLQKIKGNAERYFFPVDPEPGKDVGLVGKLMQWKMSRSEEDRLQDRAPNLELALGAESKPMTQGTPMFLVGKGGKKINQDHCSSVAAAKGDEEDISASLSLSLSFPFPDKEQNMKSLSNSEQLMPERRRVNTSLLLYGGLREK